MRHVRTAASKESDFVSQITPAMRRPPARGASTSPGVDWHALLHPKGLREGPAGALFGMVCVLVLALIFMVEATRPYGSSIGSLTVVPVLGAAWLLQRPLVLALSTLAVVTRIALIVVGQTNVATGVAQIVAIALVAVVTDVAAERSLLARVGELRAEGIRELSHLLDTVRRLSASHDADAVVHEVVMAASRAMSRDNAPAPRATLVRLDGEQIRELVVHDDEGPAGGFEVPLATAPPMVEAIKGDRAVAWPVAALESPLRELQQHARVLSGAYAPIRVGGDVYGVLSVSLRRRGRLDASELRLLAGMADLAGLALANAERLRLERAHLRRAEALERAKGAFLNRASHELRTPLTVLRGYLHLLEDGAFGELNQDMSEDVVPALITSVEEINSLVEGMLVAARLEYGVELALEPLDLRDVVRDTVRGVEETFAGEPAPTVIVESPAGPVTVLADREQLSTVLANLVRNAMKFSPPRGEVRCTVARRGVVGAVSVGDHGPGIPSEQLPRLFTRFGRIDVPGSAGTRGAGLGLYIARELARMHGGDVTVQTQPGAGSTFELTLPLDTDSVVGGRPVLSEVSGRAVDGDDAEGSSAAATAPLGAARPMRGHEASRREGVRQD
jgi:signal transduction histidine kinase